MTHVTRPVPTRDACLSREMSDLHPELVLLRVLDTPWAEVTSGSGVGGRAHGTLLLCPRSCWEVFNNSLILTAAEMITPLFFLSMSRFISG